MNKLIGILGCGGGVGQYVVNYLKEKYPLKCGQRKIVNMNADTDIELELRFHTNYNILSDLSCGCNDKR